MNDKLIESVGNVLSLYENQTTQEDAQEICLMLREALSTLNDTQESGGAIVDDPAVIAQRKENDRKRDTLRDTYEALSKAFNDKGIRSTDWSKLEFLYTVAREGVQAHLKGFMDGVASHLPTNTKDTTDIGGLDDLSVDDMPEHMREWHRAYFGLVELYAFVCHGWATDGSVRHMLGNIRSRLKESDTDDTSDEPEEVSDERMMEAEMFAFQQDESDFLLLGEGEDGQPVYMTTDGLEPIWNAAYKAALSHRDDTIKELKEEIKDRADTEQSLVAEMVKMDDTIRRYREALEAVHKNVMVGTIPDAFTIMIITSEALNPPERPKETEGEKNDIHE